MFLFLRLLLAHMIADFPLQSGFIYKLKNRGPLGITPHALIVFGCMAILSWPYLHLPLMWAFLIFLAISHFVQDRIKIIFNSYSRYHFPSYLLDQALHVGFIALIFLTDLSRLTPPPAMNPLSMAYNNNNIVLFFIILISASFNGYYMIVFLKRDLWNITSPYSHFERRYGMLERCILACITALGGLLLLICTACIIPLTRMAVARWGKSSVLISEHFSSIREIFLSSLIGFTCGAIFYILITP